jgi:hypothetical protein
MGAFVELETTTVALSKQNIFKTFIFSIEIVIIIIALFLSPSQVQAHENAGLSLPDFSIFVDSVQDGQADTLKGVYVPGVLAYPVTQQPIGQPGFVSSYADVITQFSMATEVGNVGLLAHNYLAGQTFPNLSAGHEVRLVYGDGKVEYFVVTETLQYQALQPYSPYSEFRNLETSQTITADTLFRKVYRGDRHVTFQVCIEAEGIDAWGRLFVIAEPKSDSHTRLKYTQKIKKYLMIQ